MASYFGEVLESSSRAYVGDNDDDTDSKETLKSEYEVSWNSDRPDELDLFFVTVGRCCRAFSALIRQKSSPELVGTIAQIHKNENKESSMLRTRKELPSCIYKLRNGVYICEVSADVQVTDANCFAIKLNELILVSKEVIVITSLTSNRYLSWNINSTPFIKGLASSSYTAEGKALLAPQLESPNIVSGVAASVLIICEIKKIPGCLYVCYTPKEDIDSSIFSLFQKLFAQVPCVKSSVTDIKYESKDNDCFTYRSGNLYL